MQCRIIGLRLTARPMSLCVGHSASDCQTIAVRPLRRQYRPASPRDPTRCFGTLSDSTLIARPLGRFRQLNYASPAYIARYGMPRSLEDLAHHRMVHYVSTLGAKPMGFEYFDGERTQTFAMQGSITVNNSDAYQAACLVGLGIIQAPESGSRDLVASGALIEVMPQYLAEPMPVSLLYANRRHLPKRARVFMDWMAEVLRANVI